MTKVKKKLTEPVFDMKKELERIFQNQAGGTTH